MFGLLNLRGGRIPSSGGASTSRPISTRVLVLSRSTITSTDPGTPDATDMPKSVWKSSGEDLGFGSTENTSTA